MKYDPMMVQPMRDELTMLGFTELRTADEVDAAVQKPGVTMIVINSVCGCSAGGLRPAVAMSMNHSVKPDQIVTVFAGMDIEATERVRTYFTGMAPSSPSIGLLQDGKLVAFMPRHHIEGRTPEMINAALTAAFDEFCGQPA